MNRFAWWSFIKVIIDSLVAMVNKVPPLTFRERNTDIPSRFETFVQPGDTPNETKSPEGPDSQSQD
jgi:hypothetical protein